MARKKKSTVPPVVFKIAIIVLVIIGVCFGVYKGISVLLTRSEFFKVKSIVIDPSLHFINKRDLRNVKGKNLFSVNLKKVERNLNRKYPQAADLKVAKRFPDQVYISAKKRMPIAQAKFKGKYYVVDEKAILLSVIEKADKSLPEIVGSKMYGNYYTLGLPLKSGEVHVGLKIVRAFISKKELKQHKIEKILVNNLEKTRVELRSGLEVILDKDKIKRNVEVFAFILSQKQLNLKEVKYVDLRFKEPIIGKR